MTSTAIRIFLILSSFLQYNFPNVNSRVLKHTVEEKKPFQTIQLWGEKGEEKNISYRNQSDFTKYFCYLMALKSVLKSF